MLHSKVTFILIVLGFGKIVTSEPVGRLGRKTLHVNQSVC